MDEDKDPWDRQKGETNKSYSAFCIYKNMGPLRSLQKAANEFFKDRDIKATSKRSRLSKWSMRNGWVARAEAYDHYLEETEQRENLIQIKKMAKRHAEIALSLLSKSVKQLIDIKPEDLTARDTLSFISEAVRIERLSRGAPDRIYEHGGEIKQVVTAQWIDDLAQEIDEGSMDAAKDTKKPAPDPRPD